MKFVRLIRVDASYDYGTFGVLMVDGEAVCLTLEDYYRENKKNVSCIPAGQYTCRRYASPKFGETFYVDCVSDRSGILFHKGNTDEDTSGCILLGSTFGEVAGKKAILNSSSTMSKFLEIMKDEDEFKLSISEDY